MTFPARQISVAIARSTADVYEFASDPLNMPKWASGLSKATMKKQGDSWLADSPMGNVRVKFARTNDFGVLDHDVTLPNGDVNHNPLRVVKNGTGSEVIFTLYRLNGVSDQDYERDAKTIDTDLHRLKSLLEK